MSGAQHWHDEARRWAARARTPGHDAYWDYRDAFFELVPPPGRATLEVGCGEGRVSRDLAARGHTVTGVDVVGELVDLAVRPTPGRPTSSETLLSCRFPTAPSTSRSPTTR